MDNSQKRAVRNYRSRLNKRGLARFEVLAKDADRDLIRMFARCLAEEAPEAPRLRVAVTRAINRDPPRKGGILAALRRSPLVGTDLEYGRDKVAGRDVQI